MTDLICCSEGLVKTSASFWGPRSDVAMIVVACQTGEGRAQTWDARGRPPSTTPFSPVLSAMPISIQPLVRRDILPFAAEHVM